MNKYVFIFLILLFNHPNITWAETIRLTSGEWPPFTSEYSLKHNGLMSRIVTEAFAMQGILVEYGYFPWKRSLRLAREGKWDGSVGWAIERPDLAEDFYLSHPINSVPKALFSLKKASVLWDSMEDLRGKKIGVTDGYFYGDMFEQAKQSGVFYVQSVIRDEHNVSKLLGGRFDAFAMELDTGLFLIHKILTPKQADSIIYHPKLLVETFHSVIFSKKLKKSPYFMNAFNLGLKQLKESSKYDQYFEESRQGLYFIVE